MLFCLLHGAVQTIAALYILHIIERENGVFLPSFGPTENQVLFKIYFIIGIYHEMKYL